MADEITTQFTMPDPPATLMAQWRDTPPTFLTQGRYQLVDEAYDALVFEADTTSFGQRLLMFGSGRTLYRLTVVFNADGTGTRLTISGQAIEQVRERIAEVAAEHGGPRTPIV